MNGETVHALRGVSLDRGAGRVRRHRGPVRERQVHPAPARRRHRRAERRQRRAAGDPARDPRAIASSRGSASPGSASSSSASTCCRCSPRGRTSSCRWPRPVSEAPERRAARPGAAGLRRARPPRGPPRRRSCPAARCSGSPSPARSPTGPRFSSPTSRPASSTPATGREILDLFRRLNRDGTTLLVVTHDERLAAQAGRVVHMLDGRIAAETTAP